MMGGGRAWMTSEVRKLHELRAKRLRMADIARQMNRTEQALYSFLRYVPWEPGQRPSMGRIARVRAPMNPSERFRRRIMRSIARFANNNELDFDTAARRLLSGERAHG